MPLCVCLCGLRAPWSPCWRWRVCCGWRAWCRSWTATASTALWCSHCSWPCSQCWHTGSHASGSLWASRSSTKVLITGLWVSAPASMLWNFLVPATDSCAHYGKWLLNRMCLVLMFFFQTWLLMWLMTWFCNLVWNSICELASIINSWVKIDN